MKNGDGYLSTITLLLLVTCILILSAATASDDLPIKSFGYSPERPAPGSTVTFNATVIGNNISVYVSVSECMDEICFVDSQNASMQKVDDNNYQANVILKHEEATSVHYYITVESNGSWYKSKLKEFNLSEATNPINENDTSGFEFVYLVISVMFILFMYNKRKRSR